MGFCSEISNCQSNQIPSVQTMAESAARGQTTIMINLLKLDSTLYESIYRINYEFQIKEISSRFGKTKVPDYHNNYISISRDRDESLRGILTPDQYTRYLSMMEEWNSEALKLKQGGVN